MKHIEASKKIVTSRQVDVAAVKYSLIQRMRGAFNVETVGEGQESFSVSATSKIASYAFSLGVSLRADPDRIRILIDGQNEISMATKAFYVISLFLILVMTLFSETLDPDRNGVALNAMFFLVIGGFIIYDHTRKMEEPEIIIRQILDSVEAEFG